MQNEFKHIFVFFFQNEASYTPIHHKVIISPIYDEFSVAPKDEFIN